MQIDILTLFPEIFQGPFDHSIIKIAREKEKVQINIHNIRDYSVDKHKRADDYPYGGGSGMVMMAEPVVRNIEDLKSRREYEEVIFLTPDGDQYNQSIANELSLKNNIILICGHYKGVDERVRENYITREISIGDYVLSGGEIPAMVICDSLIRIIPGVLGDETSALSDSFQNGILSPPVYTRPYDFRGLKVPDILRSGNDKNIKEWQHEKALEKTRKRRPDLLK